MTGRGAAMTRELARTALRAADRDACPLSLRVAACVALDVAGVEDEAMAGLDATMADVRLPHDRSAVAFVFLARVAVSLRHGRVDMAAKDLTAALRMMPARCWHPQQRHVIEAMRLLVRLRRKNATTVRRTAGEGHVDSAIMLYARGLARLSSGDAVAASNMLLECGRLLLNSGMANPLLVPWRPAAVTALRARGADAQADHVRSTHDALVRTRFASDGGRAQL